MPVQRHDSLAGKLLQKQGPYFPCRSRPAGESLPAVMPVQRRYSLAGKLPQRQGSFFPCRSRPADESLSAVMPVDRHDSLAGNLLQRQGPYFPCRSRPAGESLPAVMPVQRHDSLAGKPLQRQCSFEAMAQALKKFFSLSVQPSSVGVCLAPPFLTESSKSLSSLRWCSVSLTGVSIETWQYKSPG